MLAATMTPADACVVQGCVAGLDETGEEVGATFQRDLPDEAIGWTVGPVPSPR